LGRLSFESMTCSGYALFQAAPAWGEEGAMRVQLAQQAQEILGTSDLVMIPERVDDVALLIGQMVKMGLPEV